MKKGSWIWFVLGGGALYLLLRPGRASAASATPEKVTTTTTVPVSPAAAAGAAAGAAAYRPGQTNARGEPVKEDWWQEEMQRPPEMDGYGRYGLGIYGSYEVDRSRLSGFGCSGCGR